MQTVVLMGAEAVERAAQKIAEAASLMARAAQTIDEAVGRLERMELEKKQIG